MLGVSAALTPLRPRIGRLREPAPLRRPGRLPLRLLLAALLVLGTTAWGVAALLDQPRRLGDVVLVGARSPAPLDVVLLLDESGSFTDYAAVRTAAITDLAEWAPENLRPEDTITILAFAGDAVVRMPTTTVADLAGRGAQLTADSPALDGTEILPALESADEAMGETGHTRTLVVVSDTVVSDADEARVAERVAALDATTSTVIVPAGVGITAPWRDAFPWQRSTTADPGSTDGTSLAIGTALAHATGQEARHR
ncbi:hypothetical protein ASF46_18200 [Rathayibacter sp. Leaf296]|nr:hypothetical protein ASF46_18200 [Rathayibacter sp. Leaf296]